MKGSRFLVLPLICLGTMAYAAPPFQWKGFYVGGEVGHRQVTPNWTTTQTFNPDGSSPAETFEGGTSDPSADMKSSGAVFSVLAGYNWPLAPKWYFGLEAKLTQGKSDEEINYIPGLDPTEDTNTGDGAFSTARVEAKSSYSLKARVGYLVAPTTMIYGAIGMGWQKIEAQGQCPADTWVCDPEAGTQTYGTSETAKGLLLGVGVDHAIAKHWFLRFDYTYVKYNDVNFVAMQWSSTAFGADAKLEPKSSTFSVGAGYKF